MELMDLPVDNVQRCLRGSRGGSHLEPQSDLFWQSLLVLDSLQVGKEPSTITQAILA